MAKHPYVDCEGLAGAWSLGTVQTGGFELVHRASMKGGFGDAVMDANRHLVGYDWTQDEGGDETEWEPMTAAYINGTPPCSGFSLLNNSAAAARKRGKDAPATARGKDSSINDCMKSLIKYAGRCTGEDGLPGPEVVAFESVQGAFKQGRELMLWLRDTLSELTGQRYSLTNVLMSGSSVGAAQMRHRYYPVFHRIPFGVDHPEPRKVTTYYDAMGDLAGLPEQWESQRVIRPRTDVKWLLEQEMLNVQYETDFGSGDGAISAAYDVTDHITIDGPDNRRRIIFDDLWPYWPVGCGVQDPLAAYVAEHGRTPLGAEKWWNWETNYRNGFGGACKVNPARPGYVLTGGACFDFLHWEERRYLSVRECARLMGYPDTWQWGPASQYHVGKCSAWIGKCCPVQSGRWISSAILRALDGEPDAPAEKIGEDEYLHNSTLAYKRWDPAVSQFVVKPRAMS